MPPLNVPPPNWQQPNPSTTTSGGNPYTIAGIDFSGEIWVETKSGEGKVLNSLIK